MAQAGLAALGLGSLKEANKMHLNDQAGIAIDPRQVFIANAH